MEEKAYFGASSGEFVAKWKRDCSLWKTRQTLLLGGLETFSERWPREGGMRNGSVFQRPISVPRISARESGSWLATPTATANQADKAMMKWPGSRAWVSAGVPLGGPIPPHWVEWMLGWPQSWTVARGSEPLGMVKFQEWLAKHSLGSIPDFTEVE